MYDVTNQSGEAIVINVAFVTSLKVQVIDGGRALLVIELVNGKPVELTHGSVSAANTDLALWRTRVEGG